MRPLRALAIFALLLAGWSGWRVDSSLGVFAVWAAARMQAVSGRVAEAAPQPRIVEAYAWSLEPALAGSGAGQTRRLVFADARVLAAGMAPAIAPAMVEADAKADPGAASPARGAAAAAPLSSPPPAPGGYQRAEAAYGALAARQLRAAADGFSAALAADPAHPNAGAWRVELRRLRQRWHGEAYALFREGGSVLTAGQRPLYGGGQAGLRLAYTPAPLAPQPVDLFARATVAADWFDVDGKSAQAALGVGWRPFGRDGPMLSAERLVAIGRGARSAFAVRAEGAATHFADARLPLDLAVYAEAGIIGARRRDPFAGGQMTALYPVFATDRTRLALGGGAWAGVEDAGNSVARADIGPALALSHRIGRTAVELRAEYRARVAGNAAPGSGPVVTVVTRY